jgi:hypothetical protein
MEAVQTHTDTPGFETVWAALQDVAERQKENAEELRKFKQMMDDSFMEAEKRSKQLDRQLGRFGNRMGDIIESMVRPGLVEKFHELGYGFTRSSTQSVIKDSVNNIFTEIDITLENSEKAMIVEVKAKATTEDVTEHLERMEKIRRHADLHGDKRVFLGAIAGMVMDDNAKLFALKNGFYVIEPSGETFEIAEITAA